MSLTKRNVYNKISNSQIHLQYLLRAIVLVVVLGGWFLGSAIAQAATFSLSGTLYQDNGITDAGAGHAIKLAISTTTTSVFSTTTASGGTFTFTGINDSGVSSTTPFTLWLDGGSNGATTMLSGYVGSSVTAVPLYYTNVLIHGVSTSSSISLGGFTYDSTDDADILFTTAGASSTISSGVNLLVNQGRVAAPTDLTFSGNYTNNATFDSGSGEVSVGVLDIIIKNYLAGQDASGSATATGSSAISSIITSGNYLYIGKSANSIVCSQTAGSADGCELMVFDISDPTNPIYAAGRDVSGSATGTGSLAIKSLALIGNYLYVGKDANATACSQTAGSAIGCELMVFDVSSSTNPVYAAGRDTSGNSTGTTAETIYSLVINGNYLYVGKDSNSTACSQTAGSAVGCEFMIYDITTPTSPTYIVGLDSSGDSTGTVLQSILSFNLSGNYLYAGKSGSATACSQIAGSAYGCELIVFDISSSTNPIYVAGRDSSGSSTGTDTGLINSLTTADNKLYVGKYGNTATACSQTAGSAVGCEFMIYDITTPTSPTYIAGRDVSGSATGNGNLAINSVALIGNYLYVGKAGSATACSQTAGSAIGCELMVFDVSSSTNPVYAAGRDVSGSVAGTGNLAINSVTLIGNYLYVGKVGNATACSQTAGSAIGCELMVFEANATPILSGVLTGESAFNNLTIRGLGAVFSNNAAVNNLTIESGAVTAPNELTVSGNFNNAGTFNSNNGTVVLAGVSKTVDGSLAGTSALSDLLVSGSYTLLGSASTTNTIVSEGGSLTNSGALSVTAGFDNKGTFVGGTGELYVENGGQVPLSYSAGRDISGSATGVGNVITYDSIVSGNYLYVANFGNATACSQTAGSAIGCELTVFDVSSGTNPVYVAGRDVSGSAAGTGNQSARSLAVSGNYLFVGRDANATACSQTAGSAIGCELAVFDISDPTNPIYIAGRDASGSAAGTGSMRVIALDVSGSYLYVGKGGEATACSQTAGSAIGCEFMVFDISDPTSPVYVAGRDTAALATGVGNLGINTLDIKGDYLYLGRNLSVSACGQTAGAAAGGCEIHVYDISAPTNPTFVAGRDVSGNDSGTAGVDVYALVVSGNYLYAGKAASATACSQTAGSAVGCEFMLFDISSSTNPVYTAGRDISGSATGTGSSDINELIVSGDYIYTGSALSATACSQTAGSAIGCELQVYNISSSTNPVYTAGRDASGSAAGTGSLDINSLTIFGNYLHAVKDGSATACSQTAGSAIGCELIIFDNIKYFSVGQVDGNLSGSSTLGNLYTSGDIVLDAAVASTSDFIVQSDMVTLPAALTVSGHYTNNGTLDYSATPNLYFMGNSAQTISGTLSGTSTLPDTTFGGTGVKTFANNASTSQFTILAGATVEAPADLLVVDDYTNNGTFDGGSGEVTIEMLVGDYLAGRDTTGTATGTGSLAIDVVAAAGNYLYVGKEPSATACSQVEGSAIGCELMVFDISDPENPTYVAGRDSSGSAAGTGSAAIFSLSISGNYLYVGKFGSATACSQTAGSAIGCEIMVFDISSSTNPTYVAGRDASGSAAGTAATHIMGSASAGDYLYIAKDASATACSQVAGSAIGCEIMVFDISSSTNPTYVAGRDASGSAAGTVALAAQGLATYGNHLYVGKFGDVTACSQTAGSAIGCELMVFDISSPTSPTYVAGRDASGSAAGTGSVNASELAISGTNLYLRKPGNATACSQTAGSAIGCELMVFDISSPTSPTYVAGRDSSGSAAGTSAVGTYAFAAAGSYLYVGKIGDATACSQVAGSAVGCELMVFDVSSSTNPTYVAGRDSSGSATGTGNLYINTVTIAGNNIYVGKDASATACSEIAGSAIGCELMMFKKNPTISGGTFNDLTIKGGGALFGNNASATNLIIESGLVTAPAELTIAGNYENNAVFASSGGRVTFSGTSKSIDGNLTGDSAFGDVIVTGSYTVVPSVASTTNLAITSSGSLTAPSTLTVVRDLTNTGSFDSNNGTIYQGPNTEDILKYVAGRDTGGAADGAQSTTIWDFAVKDSYLFVGKGPNATACSQTAGSAVGCELQVYDISSSTNPVYVAGRDLDGSAAGTTATLQIVFLLVHDNVLYVAKAGDPTACSQTAGSAYGCELMVYDITDPENLTYVAGRDADGTDNGANDIAVQELVIKDNYLYVARNGNATACSQTLPATGCELQVYDVSSSTNPIYIAGRDGNGSATGVAAQNGLTLTIDSLGQYLYFGKSNLVTACSQTAGSAHGCELLVYDISSSTNPTFVAGRDADGSAAGTLGETLTSIVVEGDYLFASKGSNPTACGQTAGDADGCELMIFDISSRINPTYVAGRDSDTSSSGVEDVTINKVFFHEGLLYVGKNASTTPCAQTAGAAAGCELQVYDVTNPANPDYIYGLDADMATNGTGGVHGVAFQVHDDVLYFGRSGLTTACSQVAGSAQGCELTALQMNIPSLVGGFAGANALNNVIVAGRTAMSGEVEVQDLTILDASSTLAAPTTLTLTGDLVNNGVFGPNSGEVILSGANHTLTGTTTFYNLTKAATGAATTTFEAGALYTINNNWTFSGSSTSPHKLRSSNSGQYWYVDPQGQVTVSYLDVKDSNNVSVSTVYCLDGCIDSGHNAQWLFEIPVEISSNSNYEFYVGQATTTVPTILLTKRATGSITAVNDIRISIATTTTNFRFDTTNTTLSFTGSASAKVSSTVSYEDAGATLVINVTSDFGSTETLGVSGIQVGSFASISTSISALQLHTGGDVDGTPDAVDDKTIKLTGSLTIQDHALDQVANQFSFANKTDEAFFAFNLTGTTENATITDMVLTLSGVQGLTTSKMTNFRLYKDINADRVFDGGDVLIDGAGILTINGQHGAVTFSTDFVASTSANYIVIANTTGIATGDAAVFSLTPTGLATVGSVSGLSLYQINTVSTIQHFRGNSGGGGSPADRIGGAPPAGDGDVGGGDSDGGDAEGVVDGANIATDPNYVKPSATGDVHNEWTNGANAYDSDGIYATAASTNLRQTYNGFAFGIPDGNTIQGVDVKIDASGTTAAGTIDVALSWDGGASFTSAKATPTVTGTDVVYTVGGPADTWGRAWSAAEFSTTNFRLRVTAQTSSNTLRLDALQIQVYHQAGGGGSGGGGGI